MGLAVLTKGPVGFVLPALTISLYLFIRGELHRLRTLRPLTGLLISAAIVAGWLVPSCLVGDTKYTLDILFAQNFGRMVNSFSHKSPFYDYILNFPVDFLPWSIFIPGAAVYFRRNRHEKLSIGLPLVWFAGTFIFFSLVSGKRNLYLIPCYAAASLLIARYWDGMLGQHETGPRQQPACAFIRFPALVLGGLLTAAAAGLAVVLAGDFSFAAELYPMRLQLLPAVGICACGGIACLAFGSRDARPWQVFSCIGGVMVCAALVTALSVFPAWNSLKSPRHFCMRIKRVLGPDDILIASFRPSLYNYYLDRRTIPLVRDPERLRELFAGGQRIFIIAKDKHLRRAPSDLVEKVTILDSAKVGSSRYYFLSTTSSLSQAEHPPQA